MQPLATVTPSSPETAPRALAAVRPRYLSERDALPLDERYREEFLRPEAPVRQWSLVGPRGAGATTALAHLRALTAASPERVALGIEQLLTQPEAALALLRSGRGVLLLDTSVTPIAPPAWRLTRLVFSQGIPGHPDSREVLLNSRLVVTRPGPAEPRGAPGDWPGGLSAPSSLALAPWGPDELLELLGAREPARRAELLPALRALPAELCARPRAATWLVEAALRLPPGSPVTLARLFDEVLAALSPWSLRALRGLEQGSLGPEQLQELLSSPPARIEEPATLFEIPRALAHVLLDPAHDLIERAVALGFLRSETLAWAREHQAADPGRSLVAILLELGVLSPGKLLALSGQVQPDLGGGQRVETRAPLALPGLEHRLGARECARGVALGQAPQELRAAWLPYLREDLGARAQRRLVSWLRDPDPARAPQPSRDLDPRAPRGPLPRDSAAATLLWVSGVTPPLDAKARPLDLREAQLAGINFPGVHLAGSDLTRADLGQARCEGADLSRTTLVGTRLRNASLDGANLAQVVAVEADFRRATLRGARLPAARLTRSDLGLAALEGLQAPAAWLNACDLRGARLERALLARAHLVECRLSEATLAGADLTGARLLRLDLRQTDLSRVHLSGASLTRCALSGLDLREVEADGLSVTRCELSGADLYGASLRRARFHECWLRGARLRRADLRGVALLRVHFGEPEGERPAADLRDADLRGATLLGTDLRGVDLRGARLDDRLRALAERMGARLA